MLFSNTKFALNLLVFGLGDDAKECLCVLFLHSLCMFTVWMQPLYTDIHDSLFACSRWIFNLSHGTVIGLTAELLACKWIRFQRRQTCMLWHVLYLSQKTSCDSMKNFLYSMYLGTCMFIRIC